MDLVQNLLIKIKKLSMDLVHDRGSMVCPQPIPEVAGVVPILPGDICGHGPLDLLTFAVKYFQPRMGD